MRLDVLMLPVNFAFPRLIFGAGSTEPDGAAGGGLRDGHQGRLPSPPRRPGGRGSCGLGAGRGRRAGAGEPAGLERAASHSSAGARPGWSGRLPCPGGR
jgi:hypothetical protein